MENLIEFGINTLKILGLLGVIFVIMTVKDRVAENRNKNTQVSPSNSTELLNTDLLESKVVELPVLDIVFQDSETFDIEFGIEKNDRNPWITSNINDLGFVPKVGDILKVLPPQVLGSI
jgi:hypothetical protein